MYLFNWYFVIPYNQWLPSIMMIHSISGLFDLKVHWTHTLIWFIPKVNIRKVWRPQRCNHKGQIIIDNTLHRTLIEFFLIYCISFSGVYTGLTPFLQLFDYKHKQVHEENMAEIRQHVARKRNEVSKNIFVSHIFFYFFTFIYLF